MMLMLLFFILNERRFLAENIILPHACILSHHHYYPCHFHYMLFSTATSFQHELGFFSVPFFLLGMVWHALAILGLFTHHVATWMDSCYMKGQMRVGILAVRYCRSALGLQSCVSVLYICNYAVKRFNMGNAKCYSTKRVKETRKEKKGKELQYCTASSGVVVLIY